MTNVFISYSRADEEFVARLRTELVSRNITPWIDKRNISAGQKWDNAVEQALEACDVILVVLSPASVRSQNVQDEVAFALEANRRVIPLIYQHCRKPLRLNRLNHVDFTEDFSIAMAMLEKNLNTSEGNNGTASSMYVADGKTSSPARANRWRLLGASALVSSMVLGIAVLIISGNTAPVTNTHSVKTHNSMERQSLTIEAPALHFHLAQLSQLSIREVKTKTGTAVEKRLMGATDRIKEIQMVNIDGNVQLKVSAEQTEDVLILTLLPVPGTGKLTVRVGPSDSKKTVSFTDQVQIVFDKVDTSITLLGEGTELIRVRAQGSDPWENIGLKSLVVHQGRLQIHRF